MLIIIRTLFFCFAIVTVFFLRSARFALAYRRITYDFRLYVLIICITHVCLLAIYLLFRRVLSIFCYGGPSLNELLLLICCFFLEVGCCFCDSFLLIIIFFDA